MGSAALHMFSFIHSVCSACFPKYCAIRSFLHPLRLVVDSPAQLPFLLDFQAQTLSVVLALTLVLFCTPALVLVLGLH